MSRMIQKPFFVFNPKSYLFGEELLALAKVADELAATKDIRMFITVPYGDIDRISKNTKHVIVTAQHISGIKPGRGMGQVLADSLYEAGARATFLNHAENPLTLSELINSMERAKELGMTTIVCADSVKEAQTIASLTPDIILCEPTELIGTGKTSDDSYITTTNEAVKSINEDILVMQAAGISTAEDVYRTMSLGADGTGCTSGIVAAENPEQMLRDMVDAVLEGVEGIK
ncbi:triose-phosphate isomerase [Vagococcus fluvialis]|uniref:triose-phosphate isomerase n=1 Tax=Vagococcus fluvialis TaxID=2738 RepID=UPI001A9092EE|nr:triose-phosphate isomerase [Vagococcus fluvialis]MBO0428552.1 triose-phosphate isomerase [Vagococcus fluvialis]